MYEKRCEHLTEDEVPKLKDEGSEECLKSGQTWVELRACRTCGHVGCCDSTPGKHATAHYHETKHSTMQSFEPGDDWGWCYEHQKRIGPLPPARS